ncbi:unnamed protein product, partial [Gulo gulo]
VFLLFLFFPIPLFLNICFLFSVAHQFHCLWHYTFPYLVSSMLTSILIGL